MNDVRVDVEAGPPGDLLPPVVVAQLLPAREHRLLVDNRGDRLRVALDVERISRLEEPPGEELWELRQVLELLGGGDGGLATLLRKRNEVVVKLRRRDDRDEVEEVL